MENVQFNEPQYATPQLQNAAKPSGLAQIVINLGLAKSEADAQKVLLIVLVVAVVLTIFVFWFSGGGVAEVPDPVPYEAI